MSKTDVNTMLELSAFQAAAPIALALVECDEDLRAEAVQLFKDLIGGELDEGERASTTALLAEILFPNADDNGLLGMDLVEADTIARDRFPDTRADLDRMDQEEATFAERLRQRMEEKGLNQEQLAEKVGVGQPAISMMLNRSCRPQRKTIRRFAEALDISPQDLWPGLRE